MTGEGEFPAPLTPEVNPLLVGAQVPVTAPPRYTFPKITADKFRKLERDTFSEVEKEVRGVARRQALAKDIQNLKKL